jgi:hypothetical protein
MGCASSRSRTGGDAYEAWWIRIQPYATELGWSKDEQAQVAEELTSFARRIGCPIHDRGHPWWDHLADLTSAPLFIAGMSPKARAAEGRARLVRLNLCQLIH